MFERYTDKARRVIFFARYEASGLGSPVIECHHLLLGLMRESKSLFDPPRFPLGSREKLQASIVDQTRRPDALTTSVDLPLAPDAKRSLAHAAEEANALSHPHIGPEHLLLGILRVPKSLAAQLLSEYRLTADRLRSQLREAKAALNEEPRPETQSTRRFGQVASPSLLPLAADAFRALAFAIEEAEALGQTKVGIDHMLLGILRHGESLSAKLLAQHGVQAEVAREQLKRTIQGAGEFDKIEDS